MLESLVANCSSPTKQSVKALLMALLVDSANNAPKNAENHLRIRDASEALVIAAAKVDHESEDLNQALNLFHSYLMTSDNRISYPEHITEITGECISMLLLSLLIKDATNMYQVLQTTISNEKNPEFSKMRDSSDKLKRLNDLYKSIRKGSLDKALYLIKSSQLPLIDGIKNQLETTIRHMISLTMERSISEVLVKDAVLMLQLSDEKALREWCNTRMGFVNDVVKGNDEVSTSLTANSPKEALVDISKDSSVVDDVIKLVKYPFVMHESPLKEVEWKIEGNSLFLHQTKALETFQPHRSDLGRIMALTETASYLSKSL